MAAELARLCHPMLAAVLTVGLAAAVQAETQPEAVSKPAQEIPLTEELELIKEEETVSIASRYEQPLVTGMLHLMRNVEWGGRERLPETIDRVSSTEENT